MSIRAISEKAPFSLAPLDEVGWLAQQPEDFRAWAAQVGRWKIYAPGAMIYQAGDEPDGMYGLASGSLEVTFPLVADEPVIIHRAEAGFWIGDSAELAGVPRLVTLTAATKSRLLFLPGREIRSLLAREPAHWQSFYRLSHINFSMSLTLFSEALALTVRARVSRRLLSLPALTGEATITQNDLAKLVGVARSTLRRVLVDLAERGAVELGYRRVRVLDRSILISFQDEQ